MRSVTYRLQDWAITVRSDSDDGFAYFDAFYDRAADAGEPDLDVRLAPADGPPASRHRTAWGVTIDRLDETRFAVHPATGVAAEEVYSTGRRLVRHFWFDRFARTYPYLVVHASAVDDGERVIAFVGDKRAGKTTLLLDSLAGHGRSLVTNDNLLIFAGPSGPVATCTPTYVKIRQDTAARFAPFLASAARRDVVNRGHLARYRRDPATFGDDNSLLLTFAAFSDARVPAVRLREREFVVVDCGFAADGQVQVAESATATRHFIERMLKTDEAVRSMIGGRLYPASSLTTPDLATHLLDDLSRRARMISYRHHGEVGPLLEYLKESPVEGAR